MKLKLVAERGVISFWPWILGINLLFILVTLVFPYVLDGFLKWNILPRFNLADEMNFAAWWSSYLLLVCGITAYQNSNWDFDSRIAWTIVALLFCFLSLDEIGSLHERIGNLPIGFLAYLTIALFSGLSLAIAIWILWKNKPKKNGVILILVGVALLVSAAPNEYLEQHVALPNYLIGPRVAFEEGLEIMGAFIILMGIAKYQPVNKLLDPSAGVIPSLGPVTKLRCVLFAGFLVHIGLAWITVEHIEIGFRGNPAVWFFMAIFGLLSYSSLLVSWNAQRSDRFSYFIVFCCFLLLSASSVYFVSPKSSSILHNFGILASTNVLLAFLLILIFILYYLVVRKFNYTVFILFLSVFVSIIWGLSSNDQFVTYVVSGFFSLVVATLFLSNSKNIRSLETHSEL